MIEFSIVLGVFNVDFMMKILFFLILIPGIRDSMSREMSQYNSVINSAEISIINGDYKKANQIYFDIFSESQQYMFAKDVWNYAISSALVKDTLMVERCLISLFEKDFDMERVVKNKYLAPILNKVKKEGSEKLITRIDLYMLIDSLYEMDQKYRIYDSMYIKYKSENEKVDSMNSIKLKTIFDKGFPSELEIGYVQMEKLELLLLHQNYGNKRLYDFTKYIEEALFDNKIEVMFAINLIMRLSGKDPYCDGCEVLKISYSNLNSDILTERDSMSKNDNFIIGYYKQKDEILYNANNKRQKIGVATVAESRRKTLFNIKNPKLGFEFFNFSHFIFTDKKQYEFFLQGFIEINE